MQKITLPNGLTVSNICLGTMMFGTAVSESDAFAVLDAYRDRGGCFLDTANNYSHWIGTGDESELLLGKWLRQRGCRDRMILATKVGYDRKGKGAGLRKEQIEHWCDESLRKLGTDYLDLYYAHTDDPATPMEETMEAFDSLVRKGKVRFLGSSNFDTWRLVEAENVTEKHGFTGYTVHQQHFTYLHPRMEIAPQFKFNEPVGRERLRYLCARNLPLVSYSCLLHGAYERDDRLSDEYIAGDRLAFVRKMAREKGVTASALVVAWMCSLHRCADFPRVIPLFSASKVDYFLKNLEGGDLMLTDEELESLNRA